MSRYVVCWGQERYQARSQIEASNGSAKLSRRENPKKNSITSDLIAIPLSKLQNHFKVNLNLIVFTRIVSI